jgi:hypothetical protein
MEYFGIYHLSKWNHQNYLIVQRTCVKMGMVLHYFIEISFAPYDTKGIFVPFNPLLVGK